MTRYAVLRSKTLDPYMFHDCEPAISDAGVLSMTKDGTLVYAFAPGCWQHVFRSPATDVMEVVPRSRRSTTEIVSEELRP